MKICVVASTYPRYPGDGSGRFVQSISEALTQIGHEVHVVAPYHPSVAPLDSPVQVHHFRYAWPDSLSIMGYAQAMKSDRALRPFAYVLSPLYALGEAALLDRLMAQHDFDAIHTHWVIPNAPAAARLANACRIPLVISLHGSDIFMAQRHRFLQPFARWSFAQARCVSACSPNLLEGAVEFGADSDKVHLIPWGADPQLFGDDVCRESAQALRVRLGLTAGQPVLLSLGRLVRKKGVRFLLLAMSAVVQHVPDAHLLIAGSGPEAPELKALVNDLDLAGSVSFVGDVPWQDVANYLSVSDIFVVPSVHDEDGNADQLPTTIPEAMAAGRPVVASRVSGIPLVVSHGETGFLVDEGNSVQLANAILALVASPEMRDRFGTVARRRVEQELNWLQVAHKFESLYLAGARHGS
jgi:glycosyltransferase involved in cell wall biosynthesis